MALPLFSAVRLITDDYLDKGVGRGAIGFVLDAYDEGHEVDFSRPDGTANAWFFVPAANVEPAPDAMSVSSGRNTV